jgi:hypothetical protein
MQTECSAERFDFGVVEGRAVEAAFDAGLVTSDAGALLLGATDRVIGLVDRFAACFRDYRRQDLVEHTVATLIGQRVFGIALGYEDLNDHDQLRHDPIQAVLAGKLTAHRADCAAVAGKSTLNRLELSRPQPTRYHKIAYDEAAIEALPVTLFLEAHKRPPRQIVLDPTTRCMDTRRAASSKAITTATAICRSIFSAGGIFWPPSCAAPISTAARAASSRSSGS